jgi:hypothetical protein
MSRILGFTGFSKSMQKGDSNTRISNKILRTKNLSNLFPSRQKLVVKKITILDHQ